MSSPVLASIRRNIRAGLRVVTESRWRDWLENVALRVRGRSRGVVSDQWTASRPTNAVRPRVFVAVHHVNWEKPALVDTWNSIADVIHYDWGDSFDQYRPSWFRQDRTAFQERLVSRVEEAHAKHPVDLFFSYLSARWVDGETIRRIGALGIRTVNFAFDDPRLFWGPRIAGIWTGTGSIARFFDLNVTVARPEDVAKYERIGARAIFLPPAGDPASFADPSDQPRERTRLTFIGQRYGKRTEYVAAIRKEGLPIETFGVGWPEGPVSPDQKNTLYAESLVTLGFGFLGQGTRVSMKGRDFEVPMTGACYVTTWEPTLAQLFVPDSEMVFYRTAGELVEKLRYLLANPDVARRIGNAGRKKALDHHQWHMRWYHVLEEVCDASPRE